MKLKDRNSKKIHVPYSGSMLLKYPLLNKESAFSLEERDMLNLQGLLPTSVEDLEKQSERAWSQYQIYSTDLERYIYLRNIQDTNETLFYQLFITHCTEILPIIYTPTVGEACTKFSHIYFRARGIFINYDNYNKIELILKNINNPNIKVIVVTDGERVLGLGDQGIGGMGISIGKLSLYTVFGGINPSYTLPIVLDIGTNNPKLINDPLYIGWRHPRITGLQYIDFIDYFIRIVKKLWPYVILQFEDFSKKNAIFLLNRYQHQLCCFNDDIQGTAAVVLGFLLSAIRIEKKRLSDQKVVIVGAGSAGCGIAKQIINEMCYEGLSKHEAHRRIFIIDRNGLLTDKSISRLSEYQRHFIQVFDNIRDWNIMCDQISLQDVIHNAQPTVLIGVSGQLGLFTKDIIHNMNIHCKHPIIMILSNPTSCMEANPEDIIQWTNGTAIVATGSPVVPVIFKGHTYSITQCNNVYIFPGLGLGALASEAKHITDDMLMAASHALANCSPIRDNIREVLLPDIQDITLVSQVVAMEVAKTVFAKEKKYFSDEEISCKIEKNFWYPEYYNYYNEML